MRTTKDDLFGPNCMKEIGKILRVTDNGKLKRLQAELVSIGIKYRRTISKTPLNLPNAPGNVSLTRRIGWLDSNVINPCERLMSALEDAHRPMFAIWPNEVKHPPYPNRRTLRKAIKQMHAFAKSLQSHLSHYRDEHASLNQEFRADLVFALTETLRTHIPTVKISRGTYEPPHGMIGPYPDYIRYAFREITGLHEPLDDHIKGAVNGIRAEVSVRLKG